MAQNTAREQAAAARVRNGEIRTARRDALAAIEEEWTQIRINHEKKVQEWEAECQRLASEGIPKRQWPKKPIRPLKPKLTPTLESVDVVEDEDGDEDDET